MDLYSELAAVIEALERSALPYALCGGLAVALHGHPRFTKDIDLLILAGDVKAAKRLLAELGFRLEAEPMSFGEGSATRTVHRVSKVEDGELLTIDLIVLSSALAEVWESREVFEWEGRRLTVVSRSGLTRMKRLAGRPQDLLDIERLDSSIRQSESESRTEADALSVEDEGEDGGEREDGGEGRTG